MLKFVNTLIANTKGEGAQSGEDFWVKAERLLFTAYVAYIVKYCKKSERNFVSLLAMIDASETREEDEDFENAIDLMFKDIEFGNEEEGIPSRYLCVVGNRVLVSSCGSYGTSIAA